MDTSKEIEFQKRLMATFKIEAAEHVESITSGLLTLEKTTDSNRFKAELEIVFRESHSLKGAARAVSLVQIEGICKSLESIFMLLKQGEISLESISYDTMHQSIDYIGKILLRNDNELENDLPEEEYYLLIDSLEEIVLSAEKNPVPIEETDKQAREKIEIHGARQGQKKSVDLPPEDSHVKAPLDKSINKETIRVPINKLDTIMRETEELISVKLKLAHHRKDLQLENERLGKLKKRISKDLVLIRKAQTIISSENAAKKAGNGSVGNQLDSVLIDVYNEVESIEKSVAKLIGDFDIDRRVTESQVLMLTKDVKDTLLMPCSNLTELLPKLVRDLSRDQGKEASLEISGDKYELDRRILERLKSPMIHIIRNSIDHGLEMPGDRVKAGKGKEGQIRISVNPASENMLEFSISDDGKGFDLEAIKEELRNSNEIKENEINLLSDKDLLNSVFESGFSTSKIITDLSGRGLGMAIVRDEVEFLGGQVIVDSETGIGSSVKLLIPLSYGNFRGVSVTVCDKEFVIPIMNIENIIKIDDAQIGSIENKEVIQFKDEKLSLFSLADILGLKQTHKEPENNNLTVLVLRIGIRTIAVSVDSLNKEEEILIRPFPSPLRRVRNFEGAALLGSGKVVLIVNVQDLINTTNLGLLSGANKVRSSRTVPQKRRALIAEDSMTARMLLKVILVSSGFDVRTAVDGSEALRMIREETPDILLSDVEMPEMNGFELTSAIRADTNLSELPVILITALKTRKDKQEGMEAGANAYIEKGKFEPKALLDIINKLI
jgi:two-component system, chemotaxis family, sensor kinase CheA